MFKSDLQTFQFYDKYSRFDEVLVGKETWRDSARRASNYLFELAGDKLSHIEKQQIYQAILDMSNMPSMRLMAMAGKAARRNNACIYNCAYLPIQDLLAFAEVLQLCMSGVGLGFSVELDYIEQLPVIKEQSGNVMEYQIPDSTEGWVDAFYTGLQAWYDGIDIEFGYSLIRPQGAILKTKGGRASGPDPLRDLLDFTRDLILSKQGQKLSSIDVYDIVCKVGDCVIMGGVRRVAFLCLFSFDDDLMLHAKDGDFWNSKPWRGNSNNSRVIERELNKEEVKKLFLEMDDENNGEPGIFSRVAVKNTFPERRLYTRFGTNACQPGFATVLTPDGIRTFDDIDVGSVIWSGKEWTTVVNKQMTGIKPVYCYVTEEEVFIGTKDHRVLTNGNNTEEIDVIYKNNDYVITNNGKNDGFWCTKIMQKIFVGNHKVYDITVDCKEHTYWTGGLLVHNCGEVVLRPFQFCNLSSVVCRPDDTLQSLIYKVKIATLIGTIQSLATDFVGLRPEWKKNAEEERLLGVDLNGQMDCKIVRDANIQNILRKVAIEANKEYAERFGINQSVAITTVKPSGNSGVLLGASSGIHARWAKYYIRNVTVNEGTTLYKMFKDQGVPMIHYSGSKWLVSFYEKSPDGAITRHDLNALQQLDYWKQVKLHYTEHNPSCTIYYRKEEVPQIIDWLYENQGIVGGLSFFPTFDAVYENAPYVDITKEEYEQAEKPVIDFSKINEFEAYDYTGAGEFACTSGQCDFQL